MGRVSRSDEATSSHARLKFEVAGDVCLELARGAMVRAGQGATPASQEEAKWAGAGGGGRAAPLKSHLRAARAEGVAQGCILTECCPRGTSPCSRWIPMRPPRGQKAGCKAGMRGKTRCPGEGGTASLMSLLGRRPGRGGHPRACARRIFPPGAHHRAVDGCPHNIGGGASSGASKGLCF